MNGHEYRLYSIDEIQNWPEPEWLIHDILPKGGFTQIYGKENCGKTFVVLDWALSIAAGIPWAGRYDVLQGPVVYIFGEGRPGLKQRVNAWLDHHSYKHSSKSVPFYAVDILPQLTDSKAVYKFIQDIIEQLDQKPQLLIFDTLARAIVGVDESASKDMGIVVAAADQFRRELGCATMLVHHTGHKDTSHGRGSSSIPGGLDTVIYAQKKVDERFVNLECKKQKEAEYFEPIKITLVDSREKNSDGKPATLVSTYGGVGTVSKGSQMANSDTLLDDFKVHFEAGARPAQIKEISRIPNGSVSSALKQLVSDGLLRQVGPEYHLTEKGLSCV